MKRIVAVTAGLSVPSSTRLLTDQLVTATRHAFELRGEPVEVEVVELRPLAHALTDHLLTGFASGELAGVIERLGRADGLIAVTPIFAASYSGLFKTFFDVLEQGSLEGLPTLVAATAGTARHSLALEHAVRPLMSYLRASVVPTAVFAATDDFGSDADLGDRIARATGELASLVLGASRPRATTADPFADPVAFEDLLRQ